MYNILAKLPDQLIQLVILFFKAVSFIVVNFFIIIKDLIFSFISNPFDFLSWFLFGWLIRIIEWLVPTAILDLFKIDITFDTHVILSTVVQHFLASNSYIKTLLEPNLLFLTCSISLLIIISLINYYKRETVPEPFIDDDSKLFKNKDLISEIFELIVIFILVVPINLLFYFWYTYIFLTCVYLLVVPVESPLLDNVIVIVIISMVGAFHFFKIIEKLVSVIHSTFSPTNLTTQIQQT